MIIIIVGETKKANYKDKHSNSNNIEFIWITNIKFILISQIFYKRKWLKE